MWKKLNILSCRHAMELAAAKLGDGALSRFDRLWLEFHLLMCDLPDLRQSDESHRPYGALARWGLAIQFNDSSISVRGSSPPHQRTNSEFPL
jgi:hypothetical protein